jgi:hypothetical protein
MTDYEQYLENQKQIDKLFYDRLDSSSAAKGDPQFAGVWVAMTEEDKPIEDYETALHAIYEKCPISRKLTDKQLISALSKQRTGLKKLAAIPLFQKSN